jgi:hydroxymethylglutaryl-CoA synthase
MMGIEAISVYFPRSFILMEELAKGQGEPSQRYVEGLGCKKMAIPEPHEDTVTMACEASWDLMRKSGVSAEEIALVVVGTETGVDFSKPVASFVQGLLGLPNDILVFDTKHACFSGTIALLSASALIERGVVSRKALVIACDIARYDLNTRAEATQGAGAVAMLVSKDAPFFVIDEAPGSYFSRDDYDFFRPHTKDTAVVQGRYSIDCYLEACERTFQDYVKRTGKTLMDFDYFLFHCPFPKMVQKAFERVYEAEEKRGIKGLPPLETLYEQKVLPGIRYAGEIGNSYSASLYLCLATLLECAETPLDDKRVALFSYGSGLCASFFSGVFTKEAQRWKGRTGLFEMLEGRKALSYHSYLASRAMWEAKQRDGSFDSKTETQGFAFLGVREHRRFYRGRVSHLTPSCSISSDNKGT